MTRLWVLCLAMLWVCRAAVADPVVASVIAIDGKLSVKVAGSEAWTAARVNMPDHLHDRLKTDALSMAALEFTVGGRIGLNKGTEIELTGNRTATDAATGTELKLNSGSIWAKMTPQKQPFRIATPSCTIGIRGTEFVVDESNGETEVSVLSGEVGVTDATQQLTIARPGNVLRIRPGQRPLLRMVQLGLLRRQLQQRHGPFMRFFDNLRNGTLPPRPGLVIPPGPLRRAATASPTP